uniref:Sorting nexin 10b n=1 Tax=Xiphophorus maculatus TaxID=8083 RepID=A0A3B5Q2I5_XIPMA
MQQVISVWVRDPRIQKNDFWHAYMDYEICLHVSTTAEKIVSLMLFPCSNCVAAVSCFQTNSVFFTKKTSRVRRRFSEFVWLRQKLQENSLLLLQLPHLPPKNPFFSLNNAQQVADRMKGLQRFLEKILQSNLVLSDSCLHLFLQSQLSISKMEACVAGKTSFTVAQAVQSCGLRRFHSEEDLQRDLSVFCDSDSDSSECRDPGHKTRELTLNKSRSAATLDLRGTCQEEMLS